MNFITNALKNPTALTSISTVASGGSLQESAKNLSNFAKAKKFEGLFLTSAENYASGFSSMNMASFNALGKSLGIGAVTLGSMKLWNLVNKKDDEEDEEKKGIVSTEEIIAVILVVVISLIVISMIRRQKMFSVMAGTNMIDQYVKFFTIPFVVFFIIWRIILPSDTVKLHHVAILAAGFSGALLSAINKFYFVYTLNKLERDTFVTMSSVFDKCQGVSAAACDHEHSGFIRAFNNNKKNFLYRKIIQIMKNRLGGADFGDMTRELAKAQKFDALAGFVK